MCKKKFLSLVTQEYSPQNPSSKSLFEPFRHLPGTSSPREGTGRTWEGYQEPLFVAVKLVKYRGTTTKFLQNVAVCCGFSHLLWFVTVSHKICTCFIKIYLCLSPSCEQESQHVFWRQGSGPLEDKEKWEVKKNHEILTFNWTFLRFFIVVLDSKYHGLSRYTSNIAVPWQPQQTMVSGGIWRAKRGV